ncbi:hypothetical protein BCR41DRAFT_192368 [Lobosporangium transversale]|uniref:Uncharacterized protein n=1 Tax=Lobosporangium transversale TaxID=64571 RepID=A0A1Y2G9I3_9FUNG|nr:hypothetical protein BCR41DRAFT_192368 [Lobosporangium transversale]ORZ04851.1 hypothetical protein BCR41DRAFT_192368 [Lobosporangium transversale]|eukprot:XP_021876788.1 hypothetical protein BCR41DRAFT_192368 [Lobosporangium transversale]
MHRSSIDTQAVSSQSPLLKNTGRIRNRFDAADAENPHGHICDECRLMRKSPDEPLGRDINPVKSTSQEVASSTDGKSSSWQLVTFSTPPGREKHGSPRAPFIPTLQDFKTSGSPLGIKRNSFTTNYAESSGHGTRPLDREVLDMESQSATNHPAMNSRRFSLSTQQQQLGVRRSSSSGIPNMFSEESRYSISGLSGVEFSQGSISPNLFADRDLEGLGPRSASNSNSDVTGEGQSARRKRASTFDGGLLLFAGQETNVAQDDLDAKAHMEDLTSDDDEDEESGIVNNLTKPSYTAVLAPTNATEPQICQICHRPFLAEPNQTKSESRVTESQLGPLKSPIPVNSDSLNIPQQPMAISPKAALERLRASDTLFPNDAGYDGHRHHSGRHRIHEADRDEAMFQLEIDDQLPYRSIADQDCLNTPCFAGPGCQERVTSVTGNSSAADEIGAIEEDGNESFWEETSTMDYGYSPGSILNGFESGLTKVDSRMSRETPGLKHGAEDEDDVEEEDDDDDDDCVASLTSRQGSHKMSHEHDHIFMPSLKGVFSNSERVAEGRNGRQDHAYVAGESGSSAADTRHPLSTTSNKDHVNVDFDQNQSTTSSETSRPLTRRQKLKQLRRLFMDIRNEIGDGSRSPSRPVPESKTFRATSLSSATEEDDDSSASFRAESFSDDSSYQYRSSNAATIVSAHRQGSATNPPSVSLAKSHDFDPNLPSFSHGLSSTRQNVGSFKMPSGTRPQQQQQTSRWSQQTQKSLIAPPSSGRKSPFEWAAAAATSAAASISSSASGIITGGFGHVGSSTSCADHSSSLDRAGRRAHHTTPQLQEYTSPTGSNHYNRQFTLSSAYNQYQQPQQCEGNFSQRKDSIPETTPIDDFQEVMAPSTTLNMIEREGQAGSGIGTSSRSDRAPGYRRRSSLGLTPTTSSATSASRIRGETENSNRWEWPIFV